MSYCLISAILIKVQEQKRKTNRILCETNLSTSCVKDVFHLLKISMLFSYKYTLVYEHAVFFFNGTKHAEKPKLERKNKTNAIE